VPSPSRQTSIPSLQSEGFETGGIKVRGFLPFSSCEQKIPKPYFCSLHIVCARKSMEFLWRSHEDPMESGLPDTRCGTSMGCIAVSAFPPLLLMLWGEEGGLYTFAVDKFYVSVLCTEGGACVMCSVLPLMNLGSIHHVLQGSPTCLESLEDAWRSWVVQMQPFHAGAAGEHEARPCVPWLRNRFSYKVIHLFTQAV
jgi:hypothetical protein